MPTEDSHPQPPGPQDDADSGDVTPRSDQPSASSEPLSADDLETMDELDSETESDAFATISFEDSESDSEASEPPDKSPGEVSQVTSTSGSIDRASGPTDRAATDPNRGQNDRTNDPGDSDPKPIAVHGNYELLKRIGRGGMGEVFLARHRQFKHRRYAVKLIRSGNSSRNAKRRFEHEIQAMGDLAHPNLIFASDALVDGDSMYLVMEYVAGSDLQRRIDRDGPFPIGQAAEILRQTALGLSHAHTCQVIHRDVKPSNLIVTPSGVVKLLDLGIASLQNDPTRMTVEGDVLGTAPFLAPELWRDARLADAGTDLYSLGCTGYSLLTGVPPFPQRSMPELLTAHQNNIPERMDQLCPDVPSGLADILERTLAKDPSARFASASEFAEAIAPYCEPLSSDDSESPVDAVPEHAADLRSGSLSPHSESLSRGAQPDESDASARWTRNQSQPEPIVGRIVLIAATLFAISSVSLVLSYFGPLTTETWQLKFDQVGDASVRHGTGFAIEWFRAFLFIGFTVSILGTKFTREIRTFFDVRQWTRSVILLRLAILMMIGVFVVLEGTRQLSVTKAPAELAAWGISHGIETTASAEALPYRPYLVYSLINYVIVMGGLFTFPFIRFCFSDLRYILRQLASFLKRQGTQTNGKRLTANLHRFGTELRGLTGRYISILGVATIGAHYDYWIGSKTLTEEGQNTMLLGMALACSAIIFVLTIAFIFFRGFDCTSRRIASHGSIEDERALSQVDTVWFLKTTLLYNLGGLVCISVVLLLAHALLT